MMTPDERVAATDKFYREEAKERYSEYLGYDNKGDFVIYKFKDADGTLRLRCDNFHFHKQGVSTVRLIDPVEAKQANFNMVELEQDRMLAECRLRWNKLVSSGELGPDKASTDL